MQDLLWADFDVNGNLVVSWRDRRNGTDSPYTTSSEIWGAYRSKDSTSFSANFKLSDNIVPYDTILSFSGNDFMCIKLMDDTLNAVWGDTRNGKLNIWFRQLSMTGTTLLTQKISSENIPNIRIYPNPVKAIVNIESKNLQQIAIYDMAGNKILEKENENSADKMKINLENYSAGTYLIEVTTSEGIKTTKIIKE